MGGSTRPSIQSVQRSLIVGILAGLIFGCIVGAALGLLYAWRVNPAVYPEGAFPSELTQGYQSHYLAMVVDSYIVNRQVDVAQRRLQTFDEAAKIRGLAERSAAFVANGQAVEAQAVNELAAGLKAAEGWNEDTIKSVVGQLSAEYQSDVARAQAINTFSERLLEGQIPVPLQPAQPPAAAPAAPPAAEAGGGIPWLRLLLFCLIFLVVAVLLLLFVGRLRTRRKVPARPEVVWEGEGPAPLKQWTGTYTLGQDTYDEFFTIETLDGDFLGESGMGILETIPGTSPKQVTAFDVGLFDKTDITTLSRVVMSEYAYHDDAIRAKVDANPQAEAILAQPGKEFTFETSALRVVATIDDMEYGEGNVYFDKLKVTLNVFLKEGADLKVGTMDVPEQFRT